MNRRSLIKTLGMAAVASVMPSNRVFSGSTVKRSLPDTGGAYKLYQTDKNTYIISGFNVLDYGAKGDGTADDTSAIQTAINAANGAGGGIVYMPAGKYRVTSSITIQYKITLCGHWTNPENDPSAVGGDDQTVIICDVPASASREAALASFDGVILFANPSYVVNDCAVRNLAFYYPNQTPELIRPYPPTIAATVHGNAVYNVTFINSFIGINFGAHYGGSMHRIENVYGTILDTGVMLHWNLEFSAIVNYNQNLSYWQRYANLSNNQYNLVKTHTSQNAEGINLGKVDGLYCYDISVEPSEYKYGIHFYDRSDMLAQLTNEGQSHSVWNVPPVFAYGTYDKLNSTVIKVDAIEKYYPHIIFPDRITLANGQSVSRYYIPADAEKRSPSKTTLFIAKDFGAKGNGTDDDTAAVKAAIFTAKTNGGGIVFFPAGTYVVKAHLSVPENVELVGDCLNPYGISPSKLYFPFGDNEDGAAYITLERNCGVSGIALAASEAHTYDKTGGSRESTPFPWMIMGKGENVWTENIHIENAYNGVNFYDYKCNNFTVNNVIGIATHIGMKIGGGSKNGVLNNVLFFMPGHDSHAYFGAYATGYIFGEVIDLSVFSLSCFGLNRGLVFEKDSKTGGEVYNVQFFNLHLDLPKSSVCLALNAGTNIVALGFSLFTISGHTVLVDRDFTGKAILYGVNNWSRKPTLYNPFEKDVKAYNYIYYPEGSEDANTEYLNAEFITSLVSNK